MTCVVPTLGLLEKSNGFAWSVLETMVVEVSGLLWALSEMLMWGELLTKTWPLGLLMRAMVECSQSLHSKGNIKCAGIACIGAEDNICAPHQEYTNLTATTVASHTLLSCSFGK